MSTYLKRMGKYIAESAAAAEAEARMVATAVRLLTVSCCRSMCASSVLKPALFTKTCLPLRLNSKCGKQIHAKLTLASTLDGVVSLPRTCVVA